ncbi:MAG: dephospho-CoA kinase [Candidatus Altiarchaeota archaeon]|nr:dephospho-CoA kinase [Candidatus Altiarchaeota archaeon]
MIIAVSGGIGAGETTLAKLFKKKGFSLVSESDLLRKMLKKQGEPITRENLRELGDKLRKDKGPAVLAEMAWSQIKSGDWVIDALYTLAEFQFLKSKKVVVIAVTAPVELRFKRATARGDSYKHLEEFVQADKKDSELGIKKIIEQADFLIENSGTLDELAEMVDGIISCLSRN